jgi:hypothetical protein
MDRPCVPFLHISSPCSVSLWCMLSPLVPFLAYFPKVGLCDLHLVCIYVFPPPLSFFDCLNQCLMKLAMYIMATEPVLTAYFINPFHQSVSVYLPLLLFLGQGSVKSIPPFIARQRLNKHFPHQRIHATVEKLLDVSFCMPSVSYQRRVCGSVSVSPCHC